MTNPLKATSLKTIALSAVMGSLLLTTVPALAANKHRQVHTHTTYANVLRAEPIYREVAYDEPTRECWIEERRHTTVYEGSSRRQHRNGGNHYNPGHTVIGGLIGGVVGNQLGRHTGSQKARVGATVAGAIIGSAIAGESSRSGSHHRSDSRSARRNHRRDHRYGSQHNNHTTQRVEVRPVERCATRVETRYEKRVTGYNVTYRYRGREYTTRTKTHPGRQIALEISARPVNR